VNDPCDNCERTPLNLQDCTHCEHDPWNRRQEKLEAEAREEIRRESQEAWEDERE
jgi:hypothetical protein